MGTSRAANRNNTYSFTTAELRNLAAICKQVNPLLSCMLSEWKMHGWHKTDVGTTEGVGQVLQ